MLVSGGAWGVDGLAQAAAVAAGGQVIALLPHGGLPACARPGVCWLSVVPPGAPFGVAAAMERNALIYAACPHVLAVEPRFRSGGTWHGAVGALRRRLSVVHVWAASDAAEDRQRAVRALVALGARPAPEDPKALARAWLDDDAIGQPGLWDSLREPVLAYAVGGRIG